MVHRTLGVTYGVAASALAGTGVSPLVAGLGVGAAGWVVVDEGTSITLFRAYPVESHLRGVAGHITFGLATGIMLSLLVKLRLITAG